jgi:hypothetical protein
MSEFREIERTAREIGVMIGRAIEQSGHKGVWGFALMLFKFNGGEFTWISNANREDMVKAIYR